MGHLLYLEGLHVCNECLGGHCQLTADTTRCRCLLHTAEAREHTARQTKSGLTFNHLNSHVKAVLNVNGNLSISRITVFRLIKI